jgi:hypothetical protein
LDWHFFWSSDSRRPDVGPLAGIGAGLEHKILPDAVITFDNQELTAGD